jgi:pyruvate,water dikinase
MAVDVNQQALPVPPDFPVQWERPEEARLLWQWERMHWPAQVYPLEEFVLAAVDGGFNAMAAASDMPVRFVSRAINSYVYQAIAPAAASPAEMEALGQRAEAKLKAAIGRLGEAWEAEYLPEVQEHLAFWTTFDLQGATLPQLVAHLDHSVARFNRLWEIHFRIAIPMILAMSLFDDLYRDLFGNEDAFGAQRLTQGLPNKSLEADQALWRLSRRALALPEVRRVLEEEAAAGVVAALAQTAAGRAFLAELRAYLNEYGQRGADFLNLAGLSWIEDPTPALKSLKDYLAQPDRDLAAEQAALAAEREAWLAHCRAQLAGYPAPVVGQFEALLAVARAATMLQENHNYWIDQRGLYQMRRVLIELGRRLAAAGAIAQPEDVFYLRLDELRTTAAGQPGPAPRALVAERRAAMAHFAAVKPPHALGSLPPGPPPDSPMARGIFKFFGGPPQPPVEPGLLKGNAGSPGVVRGRARVVRSLAEAGALQAGEVLVTETTAPPWTPLFATAAAVVTDTGGILSHCAVMAREYRIPAVVGVGMATATIQTGQWLEVDGSAGTVRLIEAA